MDLPNWSVALIAPIASFAAAWLGVRVAIAEHSIRLATLEVGHSALKAIVDTQTAERSGYIAQLKTNTERITAQEGLIDTLRRDYHKFRNDMTPQVVVLRMLCEKVGLPWPGEH